MNSLFQTVTSRSENDDVVPFSSTKTKKTSKIFIKDLELDMFIGILEEEKHSKQRVLVSVEMNVAPNEQWQKDSIDDVVSYADIIERIEMIANSGHINLVETFAEKIADACMSVNEVLNARISVQKPDIIDNASSVGVEIYQEKSL